MMKKREPKISSGLPPAPPLKDNAAKIAGPDW